MRLEVLGGNGAGCPRRKGAWRCFAALPLVSLMDLREIFNGNAALFGPRSLAAALETGVWCGAEVDDAVKLKLLEGLEQPRMPVLHDTCPIPSSNPCPI